MIFGGPHDQYQRRYETREQALKGHAEAVAKVKATDPNEAFASGVKEIEQEIAASSAAHLGREKDQNGLI